jgi:hypothetical protein
VVWRDNDDYGNEWKHTHYTREEVENYLNKGRWFIVNENMTESEDDLQWIKDIKPDRTRPQKGFIYRYYGYADGLRGVYDDIGTDDIIITAVTDDKVYFDTVNRYWANHPRDPGSDSLHIDTFKNSVGRGDIQYLGISDINESEEDNELQWIMDIKTNNDIAQEIYDGLEWYKEPNVSTDFVKNQWSDINFSVRPGFKEKPIISPSSFYRGFTKWAEEKWGIEKERTLDVYWKLIALIHNKIKKPITESDDLDWIKDVNPIPELKVGICFTDVMDATQREWTIVALPKLGKSRTKFVRLFTIDEEGEVVHEMIRKDKFQEDVYTGRYKPCQR